jgi:hypothetical protein
MDREKLTFEQAEGAEPLPSPLALKEVSNELRAKLWMVVRGSMMRDRQEQDMGLSPATISGKWLSVLVSWFVDRQHRMIDEFNHKFAAQEGHVKDILAKGDYLQIFGFLQFVMRHQNAPYQFAEHVHWALSESRAAYGVVNGKTIAPVSNEAEAATVAKVFADLKQAEFAGALQHLTNAAELLTSGKDADSIRESVHAVESVARQLDPNAGASLGPALKVLDKTGYINPVLRSGFEKIYGYTNAEKGIRHPMLEDGTAKVDEIDAQFMFGACASFISYLIAKARKAKINMK